MLSIFKSTKGVIRQLDGFFDAIDQSGLLFVEGIQHYLQENEERFAGNIKRIGKVEGKADTLRRSIEDNLYRHSLMPDFRGDVLKLLDRMDDVIDRCKRNLIHLDIERPDFPKELQAGFSDLAITAGKAIESLVFAGRAFFKEVKQVKDQLHRVYFYEKEADGIADELKRKLFREYDDLDLSVKQHIRYFIEQTEKLSDDAEEIADMISIYAIKRIV